MSEDDVRIYAYGLCHVSACAPKGMDRDLVARSVNESHPIGISSPWVISAAPKFRQGQDNPCVCDKDRERLHWLLVC